jgi:hypothetical protein
VADPVRELALFIFQLGRETGEIKLLQKELLEKSKAESFDAGFALGRETAEKDMADQRDLEDDVPSGPDEIN